MNGLIEFERNQTRFRNTIIDTSDNHNKAFTLSPKSNEKSKPRWKVCLSKALDHWVVQTFMMMLTLWALFADDIRLWATPMSVDEDFYTMTTICLSFFGVEIILSSISRDNYFNSFYFWLDIIATITMAFDVGWIWNSMLGISDDGKPNQADKTATARQAGKGARIIRIVRVIRLIRVATLFKIAKAIKNAARRKRPELRRQNEKFVKENLITLPPIGESSPPDSLSDGPGSASRSFSSAVSDKNQENSAIMTTLAEILPDENQDAIEANNANENVEIEKSNIGKALKEITIKRVIFLVLIIIVVMPVFKSSLYEDQNSSYQYGLDVLDKVGHNHESFLIAWNNYIKKHKDSVYPLIYLEVKHRKKWATSIDPKKLRNSEKAYAYVYNTTHFYYYSCFAVFDLRGKSQLEAKLNVLQTIYLCLIIMAAIAFLSNDFQKILLTPLENMIEKISRIAENPLSAAQKEERDAVINEITGIKKKKKIESMETAFLEETITKIGLLLALGFGEAGSEIIALNIKKGGGEVDPMIPGKYTICIFGFCDIRNFTDTTEVLQENVLNFVNEIAYIVHSLVDKYSGTANKNIGDAFLLCWKFPEEAIKDDPKNPEGKILHRNIMVKEIADMAVISFVKIIAEINKSERILKYKQNPGLLERMPGYAVKMGFGMHQGWAIEGAIGSEFKIDASYLSPNVNLASRLEAATKQFGVPLLISDALYNLFSNVTKSKFRKIDRVTVKGSKEPIELFTCDLNLCNLTPVAEKSGTQEELKHERVLARISREKLLFQCKNGDYSVCNLWDDDEDLKLMKAGVSKRFINAFEKALNHYFIGEWDQAMQEFINAQEIKGERDGPCETLMSYIEEEKRDTLWNWCGYRVLLDK
ncbi:unnamed protein product [Blepharisma stoltei]|uniref:Guanylate cyclase domain-containing protein n=1 Tax=Blepharisma stoltei TaxID=1481888 RepID=A0AAU9K4Z8_9CILI|nr:unnamed protein product [Blepharisma stoltei]